MKTILKAPTIMIFIVSINFSAEARNVAGGGAINPGPVGGLVTYTGYYLEQYTYLDGADNNITAYRVRSITRYTLQSCFSALYYYANQAGNSLIANCS